MAHTAAVQDVRSARAQPTVQESKYWRLLPEVMTMANSHETTPAGDHLLDVQQVAARLRVSPRQVWKLARANQMPRPLKLARSARWRETDVAKFIADGCRVAV